MSLSLALLVLQAGSAAPQGQRIDPGFPGSPTGHRPKVEIPWNRFYSTEEIYGLLDRIEAAFPALVSHEVIGHSFEKREMRVYTVTNAVYPDTVRPALRRTYVAVCPTAAFPWIGNSTSSTRW